MISKGLYLIIPVLIFAFKISPAIALFAGLIFAIFAACPYPKENKFLSKYLLQVSVVGLGFSMNAAAAWQVGKDGLIFTIFSVALVLAAGIILGRFFKIDKKLAYLNQWEPPFAGAAP